MATFEYERGMATEARRAVRDYFEEKGSTREQAQMIIDGMTDGRLRFWYGKIRKERREKQQREAA